MVIIKLGGSLYDLPDLKRRLTPWLRRHGPAVLVPGGGSATDVIRDFDRTHGLGEEVCHWLALRMLQVNAEMLASLLPDAQVATSLPIEKPVAVLDMLSFARQDEAQPDHLPHTWDVTSDSLALRAAVVLRARELVLLKSINWDGTDWEAAARAGVVDGYFSTACRQAPDLPIRVVNLRTWQATA